MVPLWDRAENLNRNGYGSESVVPVLHACDFVRARHIHSRQLLLLLLLLSGRHPGAAVHLLLLSGVGTRATPGADRFVLLADTGGRLTR